VSSTESPSLPGLRVGAIVLAIGGLLWWVAGSIPTLGALLWFAILGLLVVVPLVWYARRLPDDGESERFAPVRQRFLVFCVVQAIAILLVAAVCGLAGAAWLAPGLVAVVNGACFVPLGRWLAQPSYARVGIAVLVIGALGMLWGIATHNAGTALTLVGLLVAISYWVVPTVRLLQQRRRDGGPSTTFQFIEDDDSLSESRTGSRDDVSTPLDERDDDENDVSTPLDERDDDDDDEENR